MKTFMIVVAHCPSSAVRCRSSDGAGTIHLWLPARQRATSERGRRGLVSAARPIASMSRVVPAALTGANAYIVSTHGKETIPNKLAVSMTRSPRGGNAVPGRSVT